jgi:hypothetical protein
MRHCLADAAHADDAEHLARQLAAEKRRRRPAGPLARADQFHTFAHPARDADDSRHRQVGGILGEDAGRIRDQNPALGRRLEVDMIGPRSEIGDEAEAIPRFGKHFGIDPVGHGGDEHVALAHGGNELVTRHGFVAGIAARVEQFAQPRLDSRHKMPCHYDARRMIEAAGRGRRRRRYGVGHLLGLGARHDSGQAASERNVATA